MTILSVFVEDQGDDDYPDEHEAADRRDEVRELMTQALEAELNDEPVAHCCCTHRVDEHWPREGCVRRDCPCLWWAP